MKPKPNQHAATTDRREQILSAAGKAFSEAGYATTTIDAIAAEAGISKGSIYNYFASKEDLFREVVGAAVAGDEADAERLLDEPLSAREKLEGVLDLWSQRRGEYKRIGRLVLEFWASAAHEKRGGAMTGVFGQMYGRWRDRLGETIAEGIAAGEFRAEVDPHIAASLVMAAMDGIAVQMILDMGLHVDEQFMAALKRAILVSLLAETPQADER